MKRKLLCGAALSTGLLACSLLRSAMSVFALYQWGSYQKYLRKGALAS